MHGCSLQSKPQQIIPSHVEIDITPVDIIQISNIDVSNRIVTAPLQPLLLPYLLTSTHFLPLLSFSMQARFLSITAPIFHRSIVRSTSSQLKPQFHLQPKIYKRQYTMAQAMHGHSAACCSIPPIVSKGYEPKGKYETIGGLKTCKFCTIPSHCYATILLHHLPSTA